MCHTNRQQSTVNRDDFGKNRYIELSSKHMKLMTTGEKDVEKHVTVLL